MTLSSTLVNAFNGQHVSVEDLQGYVTTLLGVAPNLLEDEAILISYVQHLVDNDGINIAVVVEKLLEQENLFLQNMSLRDSLGV